MTGVRNRVAAAIRRVGGEAVLVGEGVAFPASLQPRLEGAEEFGDPLGMGSPEYYTLYAPWGTAADNLKTGDSVAYRDGRYRVMKTRTLDLKGQPVYRWAVVRREMEV